MHPKNIKLYNELLDLIQQQKYKKIIKIYKKIKSKEKLEHNIWNIFAEANSRLNNYREVAYCCNKIIHIEPNNQAQYNYALALQRLNDTQGAINSYEICIKNNAQFFNAYANCASLYQTTGKYEKSITYFLKALKINNNPDVKIQLAQSYASNNDINLATTTYRQIIDATENNEKPIFFLAQLYYESADYINSEKQYLRLYNKNKFSINVINNLGRLYEQTGNLDKAIRFYKQAIKIDTALPTPYRNLGKILIQKYKTNKEDKYISDAIDAFKTAISLDPDHPEPYFEIGKIHQQLNDSKKAINYFKKTLKSDITNNFENPDDFLISVKYFLSSMESSKEIVTEKINYVTSLFDGYADKFDQELVEKLSYQTPKNISEIILNIIDKKIKYNILDLGCGTGLCAPFIYKYAERLDGIDLSEKMIAKAEQLKLYNKLIIGEITEELSSLNHSYDLMIAADVFIYIGDIDNILKQCYKKINDNGFFVYSTELLTNDETNGFRFTNTGRYAHSIPYLNRLSEKYNFTTISHTQEITRYENDNPVIGTVTVIKKCVNNRE